METAKKKRPVGRPRLDRAEGVVRVPDWLVTQAKMIAIAKKLSVAQVMEAAAGPAIAKLYDQVVRNAPGPKGGAS